MDVFSRYHWLVPIERKCSSNSVQCVQYFKALEWSWKQFEKFPVGKRAKDVTEQLFQRCCRFGSVEHSNLGLSYSPDNKDCLLFEQRHLVTWCNNLWTGKLRLSCYLTPDKTFYWTQKETLFTKNLALLLSYNMTKVRNSMGHCLVFVKNSKSK